MYAHNSSCEFKCNRTAVLRTCSACASPCRVATMLRLLQALKNFAGMACCLVCLLASYAHKCPYSRGNHFLDCERSINRQ